MKWWKRSGKKSSSGEGWFQYFELFDWWEKTFTPEQKQYILETYKPMGGSSEDLIKGDFSQWKTTQSDIALLSNISGYFNNKDDRSIAYKFITQAENIITDQSPILDVHFLYQVKLQTYYKDRNVNDHYLRTAIQASEDQIRLSSVVAETMLKEWGPPLPSHAGYSQLAVIYEKQKKLTDAIDLCKKAIREGWNGDWEKRIERIYKKMG